MIVWAVFTAALAVAHLAVPFWGWVMIVPFLWGAAAGRSIVRAMVGGGAMGAVVWSIATSAAWLRGGDAVAERVAEVLAAITAGHAAVLPVLTVAVGAFAGATAGGAGRAIVGAGRAERGRSA